MLAQNKTAEEIVQVHLDAYNNRDIDAFMFYIDDSVEFYNVEECTPHLKGKEEVQERYTTYFEKSPELHSEITNKMVLGNKVIDYEYFTGSNGSSEPFELIFMYKVKGDKIVKKPPLVSESRLTIFRSQLHQ